MLASYIKIGALKREREKMSKKIIVSAITEPTCLRAHADIMYRAAEAFDEVHWVAAVNPHKPSSVFTPHEKIEMMEKYVQYYQLG